MKKLRSTTTESYDSKLPSQDKTEAFPKQHHPLLFKRQHQDSSTQAETQSAVFSGNTFCQPAQKINPKFSQLHMIAIIISAQVSGMFIAALFYHAYYPGVTSISPNTLRLLTILMLILTYIIASPYWTEDENNETQSSTNR
jgi:hypothetical protein